jgi:3-oxoacyl-[acyl-carrier-protein] synthase II
VESCSLGADATHLTRADPSGDTLGRILKTVVGNQPVDLIHAHGTGTVFNDPIELAAIESSLADRENRPSVYSHKGALGHSLGAAGLVAVATNCLCHEHGIIPPNIQTHDPLPSGRVDIRRELQQREIIRSVALAAGFGGAVAALTLASK